MGISTNALLRIAPTALEIMLFLDSLPEVKSVNITPTGVEPDFLYCNFTWGKEIRNLGMFLNGNCSGDYSEFYTRPATFVTMGCWGASEVIARRLVKQFGGWIKVNDCTDDWTRIDE
jgi:hypothetical protein